MPKLVLAVLTVIVVFLAVGCESGTSIKMVEPSFGNIAGNDDIVIHGSGFKPGMVVQIGENQVSSIVIDSDKRIRIKTPSGAEGKADVIIIADDGKTYVLKDGFTYVRDAPSGK